MSDTFNDGSINLDELIGDIKPNMVTPQLDKVTSAQNNRKAKVLSEILITAMVDGMSDPVHKEIIHNGQIHAVKYVNIEPLLNGPWATLSLLLLNLSYGEQSTIIEAVYPERLQYNAKAFAVIFTPELKSTTITIHQDAEVLDRLDETNAGIAMILARLGTGGPSGGKGQYIPHVDNINKEREGMSDLVNTMKARDKYRNDHDTAKAIDKGQSR